MFHTLGFFRGGVKQRKCQGRGIFLPKWKQILWNAITLFCRVSHFTSLTNTWGVKHSFGHTTNIAYLVLSFTVWSTDVNFLSADRNTAIVFMKTKISNAQDKRHLQRGKGANEIMIMIEAPPLLYTCLNVHTYERIGAYAMKLLSLFLLKHQIQWMSLVRDICL